MHGKEKDSSQFNLTKMEKTNLVISSTQEHFKSACCGDQSIGEEMEFLRQDDKEIPSKIENIKHFTVNPSVSVGIEIVPHWTHVPVTDTDKDSSHLPACLYSKKGNAAAQIELDLKSKLSSNTDTEAELRPSVLENLDTSGLNFIPILHISPVTSPSAAAKPGNNKEEEKEENVQTSETGSKAKEEDIHITSVSELTKDLDNFKRHLRDNTSTPLGRSLTKTPSGGNLKRNKQSPPAHVINSTPLHRTILSRLESTPEGAMVSANSSGFFGLSDLDDSSVNLQNTPQRTPKPVLEAITSQPCNDARIEVNKVIREGDQCLSGIKKPEYTTCPPSVSSVGSVDGKDAELHSPVTSPHSSTSGNVSDLSDSSFNISDFLGEKTDDLKRLPPKTETQGHYEGQGNIEKQGKVSSVFTDDEAKQNVQPLHSNNNYNDARRIPNPESDSQLSQGSTQSTANPIQQNGESVKPAETYISLIAKALLSRENRRMMLHEIYDKIMDVHEYYRTSKNEAWRNAVRHNLSVNECFIKVGKADTGRGFFWTIHPACVQQFMIGDFQRREARRKVKDMEDKEAAKAMFVSRMVFSFPPHPVYPRQHHPHQILQPPQHHHVNMMYHHQGYHPGVPDQLQALNHRAEELNGNGNQPIRGRMSLMPNSMNTIATTREQQRYQPYYHPASNHRQMAPVRPDRKLRDLEEAPPNVTVNSLGLFIRNGPLRR